MIHNVSNNSTRNVVRGNLNPSAEEKCFGNASRKINPRVLATLHSLIDQHLAEYEAGL